MLKLSTANAPQLLLILMPTINVLLAMPLEFGTQSEKNVSSALPDSVLTEPPGNVHAPLKDLT